MPKKGGKKSKKKGTESTSRPLITKDIGQEYAVVLKMLGGGRLTARCYDGVERLCHIRGSMHKRVWISVGDHILVSLRDFTNAKSCDVIHKYNDDEVRKLKKMGCLVDLSKTKTENKEDEDETGFTFDDI
jgi:translation initiation factor 1A